MKFLADQKLKTRKKPLSAPPLSMSLVVLCHSLVALSFVAAPFCGTVGCGLGTGPNAFGSERYSFAAKRIRPSS